MCVGLKLKDKFVCLQGMNMHRGSSGLNPFIINCGTRWS
jgi:hypothetical protein